MNNKMYLTMLRVEDQVIKNENYAYKEHSVQEYDNCTFVHCNFEGSFLVGVKFVNCTFKECNLSMIKVSGTAFRDVRFEACKLLGVRWDECHDFGFSVAFRECMLNHGSFYGLKLKKTKFEACTMHEIDFSTADLSESVFHQCDLRQTTFHQTVLLKTDFRTANNYTIDPEQNKIKKAKFALPEIVGLLAKYDIVIQQ